MMSEKSVSGSWWRRTVRGSVAAGLVGGATLASAAGIEVARAWTAHPRAGAEIGHAIGGVVVALFVVASTLLAARARSLAGVVVAASFALVAHGGVLTLEGQTIGALFLGLAPIVCVLTSLAFAAPRAEEELAPHKESLALAHDATIVAQWFDKATPTASATRPRMMSRTIACGAGLAASRNRRAMLA